MKRGTGYKLWETPNGWYWQLNECTNRVLDGNAATEKEARSAARKMYESLHASRTIGS